MSSTCMDCGQRCRGARCRDCSAEHAAGQLDHEEGREYGDDQECPGCGRPQLSNRPCVDCQRADDIVGDLDDHDEDLDELRADGGQPEPAEEKYCTPQPTSEEEAIELAKEKYDNEIENIRSVETAEVPAPAKWPDDDPRIRPFDSAAEGGDSA